MCLGKMFSFYGVYDVCYVENKGEFRSKVTNDMVHTLVMVYRGTPP